VTIKSRSGYMRIIIIIFLEKNNNSTLTHYSLSKISQR
jgi:hypothetical protein